MLKEKEKLLVMSNFSFSHSVFKRLVLQTHKNKGLFWKGLINMMPFETLEELNEKLTLYHIIPTFNNPQERRLWKHREKE